MPVNKMEGAIASNQASNPIIEDDQQLYDWGIENRLDQYYQVTIELDTNWDGGKSYLSYDTKSTETEFNI